MHRQEFFGFLFLTLIFFVTAIPAVDQANQRHVYEGDLSEDEMHPHPNRNKASIGIERWSSGIVPYEIADSIADGHAALIEKMMRKMEKLMTHNGRQCIVFRKKTESDSRFIHIFNGASCYTPVGSWGDYMGARKFSLHHSATGTCMTPETILYELAHVLGYSDGQSGSEDRLTIDSTKLKSETNSLHIENFAYMKVPYHHTSVTHQDRPESSKQTQARLNPVDILQIQNLYECVPESSEEKRLAVDEPVPQVRLLTDSIDSTTPVVQDTTTIVEGETTTTTTAVAGTTTTTAAAAAGTTTTTAAAAAGTTTTTAAPVAGTTTTTAAVVAGTTTTTAAAAAGTTTTAAAAGTTTTAAAAGTTTARPIDTTATTVGDSSTAVYPLILMYILALAVPWIF